MRRAVAGLLCLALAAGVAPVANAQEGEGQSVSDVVSAVTAYSSGWGSVSPDIASLSVFTEQLINARRQYQSWLDVLQPAAEAVQAKVEALTGQVQQLQALEARTAAELAVAQSQQAEQERVVGALARLLYQQPAPEWNAVEQLLEGADLRSFDRHDLVSQVLTANTAELEAVKQQVVSLQDRLATTRSDLARDSAELASATQQRDGITGQVAVVRAALVAIEEDQQRANTVIDQLRAEEEARIQAQAAAAAAAAAASAAGESGSARPRGGGEPAHSTDSFSAQLPASIPYRDAFLTYGLRYRVEPALLAAIASQESGFNPWAGCDRAGAGKGIMQHENQSAYCGPGAVAASVEKSAIMLASYYNRSNSWTAAIFAYNNGPGLMDEWVQYSADKEQIIRVLADYYNRQPYASPGPTQGYGSWGEWRAHIAYNYAAPNPGPGFHSVTQKWLIYRQG